MYRYNVQGIDVFKKPQTRRRRRRRRNRSIPVIPFFGSDNVNAPCLSVYVRLVF